MRANSSSSTRDSSKLGLSLVMISCISSVSIPPMTLVSCRSMRFTSATSNLRSATSVPLSLSSFSKYTQIFSISRLSSLRVISLRNSSTFSLMLLNRNRSSTEMDLPLNLSDRNCSLVSDSRPLLYIRACDALSTITFKRSISSVLASVFTEACPSSSAKLGSPSSSSLPFKRSHNSAPKRATSRLEARASSQSTDPSSRTRKFKLGMFSRTSCMIPAGFSPVVSSLEAGTPSPRLRPGSAIAPM
mmetsp:Transcript_54905/g.103104  ORF Transcript_54905/g.103104 Transcript_54905/m.103104 type:complete len:245 (-) Transcript_54905:675-1409(-)